MGDTVQIVGVPDLSGMVDHCRQESEPVFRHLVGKSKKINDFNDLGMAEFTFRMKRKGKSEMHTVWIEPFHLRLKRD